VDIDEEGHQAAAANETNATSTTESTTGYVTSKAGEHEGNHLRGADAETTAGPTANKSEIMPDDRDDINETTTPRPEKALDEDDSSHIDMAIVTMVFIALALFAVYLCTRAKSRQSGPARSFDGVSMTAFDDQDAASRQRPLHPAPARSHAGGSADSDECGGGMRETLSSTHTSTPVRNGIARRTSPPCRLAPPPLSAASRAPPPAVDDDGGDSDDWEPFTSASPLGGLNVSPSQSPQETLEAMLEEQINTL